MSELTIAMRNALKRVMPNMLQHVSCSRAEFTRRRGIKRTRKGCAYNVAAGFTPALTA